MKSVKVTVSFVVAMAAVADGTFLASLGDRAMLEGLQPVDEAVEAKPAVKAAPKYKADETVEEKRARWRAESQAKREKKRREQGLQTGQGGAKPVKGNRMEDYILRVLAKRGNVTTDKDVLAELVYKAGYRGSRSLSALADSVSPCCSMLKARGHVQRVDKGIYVITTEGMKAAAEADKA